MTGRPTSRRALPGDGFSLLELLLVVALLVVLTTLFWNSGSPSRQRQLQLGCQQNLEKIFIALQIYSNEHRDRFPDTAAARSSEAALDALVPRYTVDTSVFICPAAKDAPLPAGESFRQRTISYAYYMGERAADPPQALMSDRQINSLAKAVGEATFSTTGQPPGNNHQKRGGNFLFTDGHVQFTPPFAPFALDLKTGVVLLNPKSSP